MTWPLESADRRGARTIVALAVLLLSLFPAWAQRPDLVIADFEGKDYGDWKVEGNAFGTGPARGTLPGQMKVEGFIGHGLVNSYNGGDGSTGTLTSPPFTIERNFIKFLVGGGKYPGKTCVNLVIDGQVARTATGPNDAPGGSERLDWACWNVGEFAGRRGVIAIVDLATGGWGHINCDHIVQSDQPPPRTLIGVTREIELKKPYLNFPVKNGAPMRHLKLLVDGKTAREFDIELAEANPDWWAFLDAVPFKGRRAMLQVDKLPEGSVGLESIGQTDAIKGAETLYREALRPQFHFTSRRGWNNDPNGLVFYQGEYHLFYQHNPFGRNWGNMHWGHAVSRDLFHWRELPEALYPDEHGTMFSGSAVVDWNNTTGFQTGSEKPLVCIFTAAGKPFTQGLAFSNDRGRTWTKYPHNPVLPHVRADNRDPKVIWHAPQKQWVMALYLDKNDYGLFSSPNLKQWEKLSEVTLPDTSECPEFFEIPVGGNRENKRWVFYGGNGRYLVGKFDGRSFTVESGPHALNFGNCFYASQTFSDIPPADGRRIMVPWGQVEIPGMPFNQMIGLPVELTLRETAEGLRLSAWPVRELAGLRVGGRELKQVTLHPDENPLADVRDELFDLTAEIVPGEAEEVGFVIRGEPVRYEVKAGQLCCRDKRAALKIVDGKLRLRLVSDRVSLDIFGNEGSLYMPMGFLPQPGKSALEVYARGGNARIERLEVHPLKSAW